MKTVIATAAATPVLQKLKRDVACLCDELRRFDTGRVVSDFTRQNDLVETQTAFHGSGAALSVSASFDAASFSVASLLEDMFSVCGEQPNGRGTLVIDVGAQKVTLTQDAQRDAFTLCVA